VVAYVRTVRTASGAIAVQIVHSNRRGSREIEHIGSAHTSGEVQRSQDDTPAALDQRIGRVASPARRHRDGMPSLPARPQAPACQRAGPRRPDPSDRPAGERGLCAARPWRQAGRKPYLANAPVFVAIIATGVRTRRPPEPASTARSVVPRGPRQHDVRHPPFCGSALKTAETTAGTIPSKRNEGMKEIIIGNTLHQPRLDF
jgi:hypothetical protein